MERPQLQDVMNQSIGKNRLPGDDRSGLGRALRRISSRLAGSAGFALSAVLAMGLIEGCQAYFNGMAAGAVMGRIGLYGYSPAVILSGSVEP
jgi:hypothetical protein